MNGLSQQLQILVSADKPSHLKIATPCRTLIQTTLHMWCRWCAVGYVGRHAVCSPASTTTFGHLVPSNAKMLLDEWLPALAGSAPGDASPLNECLRRHHAWRLEEAAWHPSSRSRGRGGTPSVQQCHAFCRCAVIGRRSGVSTVTIIDVEGSCHQPRMLMLVVLNQKERCW